MNTQPTMVELSESYTVDSQNSEDSKVDVYDLEEGRQQYL